MSTVAVSDAVTTHLLVGVFFLGAFWNIPYEIVIPIESVGRGIHSTETAAFLFGA
jgi:hypothetical protein